MKNQYFLYGIPKKPIKLKIGTQISLWRNNYVENNHLICEKEKKKKKVIFFKVDFKILRNVYRAYNLGILQI